jgi:hypothetical protein
MNGVLALPTISVPSGATVKLSGCDFASPIRISAADADCARPIENAMHTASRSVFKRSLLELRILNSPHFAVF